jgi:hypothetical protein
VKADRRAESGDVNEIAGSRLLQNHRSYVFSAGLGIVCDVCRFAQWMKGDLKSVSGRIYPMSVSDENLFTLAGTLLPKKLGRPAWSLTENGLQYPP